MAYTVAAFFVQLKTGAEISPTLTTVYFSFWGVEIINLAVIKRGKIKRQNEDASGVETANDEREV